MTHLHRRLDSDVVRTILAQYVSRQLTLDAARAQLGIQRARFYGLLAAYRNDPAAFSIAYTRTRTARLDAKVEQQIRSALEQDRTLITDPAIPIRSYNYSAIRDTLQREHRISVSVPTIIVRAKAWGFWIPKRERKIHDRIVSTDYAGELVQHDSSHHRWAPSVEAMWYGITSIDDCSRLLLYADLWERESSWTHIVSLKEAMVRHGIPLRYYTDNHGIFRFIERRDHMGNIHTVGTDAVDPQWRKVLRDLSVDVTYALSPQAKGKVERPYRWMQDRVVRRCAAEDVRSFDATRRIFREERDRYNTHQVHSTTREIPVLRFERLLREGKTMLRPFAIPKPFAHVNDIFCFREERTVNGYRKVEFHGTELTLSGVLPRQTVELRYSPSVQEGYTEVRVWYRRERLLDTKIVRTEQLRGVQF
jgi:hypothetical protein